MTENNNENQNTRPTTYVKNITFNDGTKLDLNPKDIVVFVGPNNAGKSQSLREISEYYEKDYTGKIIDNIEYSDYYDFETFINFIIKVSQKIQNNYNIFNITISELEITKKRIIKNNIRKILFKIVKTENRITGSNGMKSIDFSKESIQNTIQYLYDNEDIEYVISNYFCKAFGLHLHVDRSNGSTIPLRVGDEIIIENDKSAEYIDYKYLNKEQKRQMRQNTVLLEEQGDGMRSFATLLLESLADFLPTVLMIDEPEAFLHPPQARLIGEILARERREDMQMFISTHSTDVLMGLLNASPTDVKIIRLERDGNINHAKILENDQLQKIANDPLLQYSHVMYGLFYQRVFICESDADCLFYQAILDIVRKNQPYSGDVLFIHASGKHRMRELASVLKSLRIRVDVICDIDLLKEENTFSGLLETLGGDWSVIKNKWSSLKKEIEQKNPPISAQQCKQRIESELQNLNSAEDTKSVSKAINKIFKETSPWEAIKTAGTSAIPKGNATKFMTEINEYCAQNGLWIVQVGEIEGFCSTIGGHGPKWVQEVISARNCEKDPELKTARDFIEKIWFNEKPDPIMP